ncbi:hypothetical protein HEP84_00765 [Streptomyces sp. RLB1-33]|nr:hypothetical protein [Streptomyces sp. RLB1-33]QIY68061.1 hypothetical protein HEP84_00765 [Streptomyces sp. RLB1-33]
MARERYADLNPATRPASEAYDPRTVSMAVALFGSAVLERIDDRIHADGRSRRPRRRLTGCFRHG